jgi:hypothetical protein
VVSETLRYDGDSHEYTDEATGEIMPSVTQMLIKDGKVDPTWFTAEGRRRGTEVHRLTLNYDLDVYDDPKAVASPFKGYLLAYVKLMEMLGKPQWLHLEEPFTHPLLRFGGTPDRVGLIWRLLSLGEIKTGGFEKWHPIQTALQAILVARTLNIRPEAIVRYGFYITNDGGCKALEFIEHGHDFREARKIIRKWCAL